MVIVSALLVPCMAVAYLAIRELTRSMSEDCRDAGELRAATEMAAQFRLDAARATDVNPMLRQQCLSFDVPGGCIEYIPVNGRMERTEYAYPNPPFVSAPRRVVEDNSIHFGPHVQPTYHEKLTPGGHLLRAVWTHWREEDPGRKMGEPWTLVLDTALPSWEGKK